MKKAKVTISRRGNQKGGGTISLSIDDRLSGLRVVEVLMTTEEFAEAITGLAMCEAEYSFMPEQFTVDIDSRALKVLTDWNSEDYKNEGQKAASLQVLIISAIKENNLMLRNNCIEAIRDNEPDIKHGRINVNLAVGSCISVFEI